MRDINDPPRGTLSSYAYLLLLIQFLQSRDPPVLPKLQLLVEDKNGKIAEVSYSNIPDVPVQGHNTYYFKEVEKLKDFGKKNSQSSGQLLFEFFKYYATEFHWGRHVVSPRLGSLIVQNKNDNKLILEDPFDTSHNLGRVLDSYTNDVVRGEFNRAYKLLSTSKPLNVLCQSFEKDLANSWSKMDLWNKIS